MILPQSIAICIACQMLPVSHSSGFSVSDTHCTFHFESVAKQEDVQTNTKGEMWGWANNDWLSILGWIVPLWLSMVAFTWNGARLNVSYGLISTIRKKEKNTRPNCSPMFPRQLARNISWFGCKSVRKRMHRPLPPHHDSSTIAILPFCQLQASQRARKVRRPHTT